MKRSRGWLLLVCVLCGCGGEEPVPSAAPSAHPEIVEALRADADAPRHSADGGGRVRLEGGDDPLEGFSRFLDIGSAEMQVRDVEDLRHGWAGESPLEFGFVA